MVCARVSRAHQTGISFLQHQTHTPEDAVKGDVISAILLLCREQESYDESELQMYSSLEMGESLLRLLHCDSADQLRELALTLYRFKTDADQEAYRNRNGIRLMVARTGPHIANEDHFPELHDPTSDEYKALTEFILNFAANGGMQ